MKMNITAADIRSALDEDNTSLPIILTALLEAHELDMEGRISQVTINAKRRAPMYFMKSIFESLKEKEHAA